MAIEAKDVALTIPTRGDVDLSEILSRLPDFKDILIWDNSGGLVTIGRENGRAQVIGGRDLKVYGRYAAIEYTDATVIATQDDDCILPWESILPYYEPGRLLANMDRDRWGPNWGYPDSTLVGWGAVFDRDLPQTAFKTFIEAHWPGIQPSLYDPPGSVHLDKLRRTCDVIFSSLTPRTVIDVGYRHLPWATASNRMWTGDPNHNKERNAVLELCRRIRTWPDDDIRIA